MRGIVTLLLIIVLAALVIGCAGVSPVVKQEGAEAVSFQSLIANPEQYVGRKVVLGGYILEVKYFNEDTLASVLQAPLGNRHMPKSKSLSEGRFVVFYKGRLSDVLYTRDRQITVTGTVMEMSNQEFESCPKPCIKIESRSMHLWEDYSDVNLRPWPEYPFNEDTFSID